MATKYARPNAKKFDHPPTKKSRTNPKPEVHVSVNITPTPGAAGSAMQATYLVSNPTPSAPSPLHPAEVCDISSSTKPFSAPGPDRLSPTPRCARLLTALDCTQAGRIPSVNELLSLMDREDPTANPKYTDSRSELESLGSLHDAVDVYTMPVECLATMGSLGREGAHRLHKYCRDKLFPALGIMQTTRSKSEEASIEEIPRPQGYIKQEENVAGAASIEEIAPPLQKLEEHTARSFQPRSIEDDQNREIIGKWLDSVQKGEEVEEDMVSFASVKTEVDSECEDEDEDKGSDMATVSSHEV